MAYIFSAYIQKNSIGFSQFQFLLLFFHDHLAWHEDIFLLRFWSLWWMWYCAFGGIQVCPQCVVGFFLLLFATHSVAPIICDCIRILSWHYIDSCFRIRQLLQCRLYFCLSLSFGCYSIDYSISVLYYISLAFFIALSLFPITLWASMLSVVSFEFDSRSSRYMFV